MSGGASSPPAAGAGVGGLSVLPVVGVGEVGAGDDLAGAALDLALGLQGA